MEKKFSEIIDVEKKILNILNEMGKRIDEDCYILFDFVKEDELDSILIPYAYVHPGCGCCKTYPGVRLDDEKLEEKLKHIYKIDSIVRREIKDLRGMYSVDYGDLYKEKDEVFLNEPEKIAQKYIENYNKLEN